MTNPTPAQLQRQKEKRRNPLQRKELYKAIKKDCGYHLYEIEDILASFVRVSTESLLKDTPVKLTHLCSIIPWKCPSRKFRNLSTNQIEMSVPSTTLKVVPSVHLKNVLNPHKVQKEQEED